MYADASAAGINKPQTTKMLVDPAQKPPGLLRALELQIVLAPDLQPTSCTKEKATADLGEERGRVNV
jgi:hypothetical protein